MDKPRVFIVEDSLFARVHLSGLLEESGFNVVAQAAHGNEALEVAYLYTPDIITLDNVLPDSYGLDLVEKFKEKSPTSRIIIITQAVDKELLIQAIDKGVSDYIIKPVNDKVLIDTFKKHFKELSQE